MNTVPKIERRLFIVVGGGVKWQARGRLESEIKSRLSAEREKHPEFGFVHHLLITKSMAEAAALVRQYLGRNNEPDAFLTSAAVIIVRNEALEFVSNKWARDHYASLQDHMPHPVIFSEEADVMSVNFDSYLGKNGIEEHAWQDLFPQWQRISDVDSKLWLSHLCKHYDLSLHYITSRKGSELTRALLDATSQEWRDEMK